jgi:hypothetical protein
VKVGPLFFYICTFTSLLTALLFSVTSNAQPLLDTAYTITNDFYRHLYLTVATENEDVIRQTHGFLDIDRK